MPEIKMEVSGYRCNNCGHEWLPRSAKEKPLICPKCKSARWDKEPKKKMEVPSKRPKRKPMATGTKDYMANPPDHNNPNNHTPPLKRRAAKEPVE